MHSARVRHACGGPGGLPLGSATHFQCCHSNATRAPIANPPNSAQLGGIPYHSTKLHPGAYNSVGMQPRTDTQTHVTTIPVSWSTTHAKCNKVVRWLCFMNLAHLCILISVIVMPVIGISKYIISVNSFHSQNQPKAKFQVCYRK